MKRSLEGNEAFVFDGYVGAEKESRLSIRTITDNAWNNLFAMQIFIRPTTSELLSHNPSFTIISIIDLPSPELDGTKSETFIILNLTKRLVLIGSTSYAGEIKKINVFRNELSAPFQRYLSYALLCERRT